jgi:hypothetical protein
MKKWITVAVLVVSIVCFTGIAFAVVGQIGAWSFPVYISEPGSYQLQTNLVTTNANRTAIVVTADNVTIDLNGFAIIGPNVCAGSPVVCNHNGTGIGINASGKQNIKVYNGTVRGMGNAGISTGDGFIIESVRVESNGGDGIYVNGSGTVSGNRVIGNRLLGISAGSGTVSGNTVLYNGENGIAVVIGTVSGNTVTTNGNDGIAVLIGTVSGNTVSGNGAYGLHLGPTAGYVNNVLYANTGGDVFGGVNLKPNLCSGVLCP